MEVERKVNNESIGGRSLHKGIQHRSMHIRTI